MYRCKQIYACLFFFAFVLSLGAREGDPCFEGFFQDHIGEKRFELFSSFLPYNPTILLLHPSPQSLEICNKVWPKAKLIDSLTDIPHFLWIEAERRELDSIKKIKHLLRYLHLIYTNTHFSKDEDSNFSSLKTYLQRHNFVMLSHWYHEKKDGKAIFVRRDLYHAYINALNFSLLTSTTPLCSSLPSNIEKFLRAATDKPFPSPHGVEQIDFMYMINLDERPEKFAMSSAMFQKYGVQPYRFSGVNGWKLPYQVLEEVGVKLAEPLSHDLYLATTFRWIEGKEYRGSELIQEKGRTYYCVGMSRGAIGISLSHLSVLQDAYDAGYKTIWVLEDDTVPLDDPKKLSSLIQKLDQIAPDWDILFTDIDPAAYHAGQYNICRALAMRPNYKMEPLSHFLDRFSRIDDDFSHVGMRYGAYSMIVRRSGIEKILSFYKNYGIFLPYDMDYWLIPDLHMYRLNYDLVVHGLNALTDNAAPNYEGLE